jgi:hypothetical protein
MATYLVIYESNGVLMSASQYGTSAHNAAEQVVSQYGATRVVLVSQDDDADRARRVPLAAMEGKS